MVPIDRSDTRIDELKIFINIGNTIYHRRHRRRVIVKKVENTLSFFYIRARARFLTKTGSEHLCTGTDTTTAATMATIKRKRKKRKSRQTVSQVISNNCAKIKREEEVGFVNF